MFIIYIYMVHVCAGASVSDVSSARAYLMMVCVQSSSCVSRAVCAHGVCVHIMCMCVCVCTPCICVRVCAPCIVHGVCMSPCIIRARGFVCATVTEVSRKCVCHIVCSSMHVCATTAICAGPRCHTVRGCGVRVFGTRGHFCTSSP